MNAPAEYVCRALGVRRELWAQLNRTRMLLGLLVSARC
jgi:hypothetical protein